MSESTGEGVSKPFVKGGKATRVTILHQNPIGQGEFGTVSEADVLVHGRNRKFVIKRYTHDPRWHKDASHNAARAIENYKTLKAAGLKVFPTYRLSEDGRSILMTSGNLDTKVCVDSNQDGSLPSKGELKLVDAQDKVERLAHDMFQQAKTAAAQNIQFIYDVFFFLVDKNTKDIDFVFGDLDMVNFYPSEDLEERTQENLDSARYALKFFSRFNINNPGEYEDRIDQLFHQNGGQR